MISFDNITIRFGGFELLSNISFLITKRDRIGLVGRNGAGKSTLLKIITGHVAPSEGQVSLPSGMKIGYLPQQLIVKDIHSVKEDVVKSIEDISSINKEIEELTQKISDFSDFESEAYLSMIDRLNDLTERYNMLDGSKLEERVEKILTGLGFERSDFDRPTAVFSGGWRMRIELAKVLLKNPDVLLLDEPTNHLDIESIQWLENFLKVYNGAIVLISHDRAFLDNITKRTIELSLGNMYDYPASYTKAMEMRRERREQQLSAFKNQQKMISDTEEFIERFRYKATKAVQVQQRIKQLEKIDKIEIEEEDLSKIHLKFPPAPRCGSIPVETVHLSKSYGDKHVLDSIDLIIERGEKVAFVGKNGEGKTTMARIINGELDFKGELKMGHNVKIGYFAQNQDEILEADKTVFQVIDDIAVGEVRTKVRDILGAFLFSGEDVDKKVKVLSGGERSRLAMAKLLLEPYNLLILDEPTNHLDIQSKELLKEALQKFDGTVILVSHDREFLDGLTDKLYEFAQKKIKEHRDGIYEFLRKKQIESLDDLNKRAESKSSENNQVSASKLAWEERKKIDKEIRKVEKMIDQIEEKVEKNEEWIALKDKILSDPEKAAGYVQNEKFYEDYNTRKLENEKLMKEWELHHQELEKLQQKRED